MNPEEEYLTPQEAAQDLRRPSEQVGQSLDEGQQDGAVQRLSDRARQIPTASIEKWSSPCPPLRTSVDRLSTRLRQIYRKLADHPWVTFTSATFTFIATVIGLISAFDQFGWLQPDRLMTGDFRVAVAAFEVVGNQDAKPMGEELAQGVFLRMEETLEELDPGFTIEVWGPDDVGAVRGKTREDRALSAANVSSEIGADVVVYGLLDTTGPLWTVTPEFYISEKNLVDAQEITGQHEIGRSFETPGQGNVVTRIDVSTKLGARAQLLSQVTIGLAYYAARQYSEAQFVLEQVEDEYDWSEMGGKEVLYLLIGNAAGKNRNLDLAETAYHKALVENPDYSRAYSGLGSVYYMRALQPASDTDNFENIDVGLVNQSIASYQQAAAAPVQPALSDIETKVHFGLGQAYLALYLQDPNQPVAPAIQEFEAVIDDYGQDDNPRIRELAAEAHSHLGVIYSRNNRVDEAIKHYKQARDLLYDAPKRQQIFDERILELQNGLQQ